MLINRAYYFLKPIMPWHLRLALRRWRANRRRRVFADIWPIDANAAGTPPGWPGWPGGKRFAFVLTHDVEGSKGLSRVEQLMKLEVKHGFRSSLNFVPEGEYRVADATRKMLDDARFEVGVHGLEHDGKLYSSKEGFAAKAERINQYLQRWNCSGFRSPLMQHRLGWLHRLDVEYDASTFDTDPFEPQPDGVGTVFPFWVPGPHGSGYVELPYTLVQDFTLFKILEEHNIDLWKRKVDWIADNGGMVLVNTHPDYMCFEGRPGRDEYQVMHYEELLRYVREKYDGLYWAASPREVARHYCEQVPPLSRNTRRKICIVTSAPYKADNSVRVYTETLAARGDRVDVVNISDSQHHQSEGEVHGVTRYRVQRPKYDECNNWVYTWRSLRVLVSLSMELTRLHKRNRYDVIHIYNMPDCFVFAAWYPKLAGAKLIRDLHNVSAELVAKKFHTKLSASSHGFFKAVASLPLRFADHVIVPTKFFSEKVNAPAIPKERCSVLFGHVDHEMFPCKARTKTRPGFVIVCLGGLQSHQSLDIAIQAFDEVRCNTPDAELHIYAGPPGQMRAFMSPLIQTLGLEGVVKFYASTPVAEMVEVIANADIGLVPVPADVLEAEAYAAKIIEFMTHGVPVITSQAGIGGLHYEEGDVHFCPAGDSRAMSKAMLDIINNRDLHDSLVKRGYEYVACNTWGSGKRKYMDLVDSISIERFDNIGNTLPVRTDHQTKTNARSVPGVVAGQVRSMTIKLNDRESIAGDK
jgi:glycosyltransferase involved in cell wall biosynthesis